LIVRLERRGESTWDSYAHGSTGTDGHVAEWVPQTPKRVDRGVYRLVYDSGSYFAALGIASFHPQVAIEFLVGDDDVCHVPLLLGPHAYATFRSNR
jgi:5-hydroxyisourate hydrolase